MRKLEGLVEESLHRLHSLTGIPEHVRNLMDM